MKLALFSNAKCGHYIKLQVLRVCISKQTPFRKMQLERGLKQFQIPTCGRKSMTCTNKSSMPSSPRISGLPVCKWCNAYIKYWPTLSIAALWTPHLPNLCQIDYKVHGHSQAGVWKMKFAGSMSIYIITILYHSVLHRCLRDPIGFVWIRELDLFFCFRYCIFWKVNICWNDGNSILMWVE